VTTHRRLTALVVLLVMFVAMQSVPAGAQSEKPTASDVGVTASTIRIGVVVDIDNPFVPGIFKGAYDGVRGAVKYINANGGIAGRKLAVDLYDSKLNANDTRNGLIAACEKDFALVGTTALFLNNVDDIVNCKDATGNPTGIPDVAGLVTSLTEGCSSMTYAVAAPPILCDTLGQDPQTYQGSIGPFRYIRTKRLKGDAHGALISSNDTPDARRSSYSQMLMAKKGGIVPDVEASLSSRDPQSAFTPVVQQMKAKSSNFSYLTMSLSSAVQLRQEAALQGIPTDSVAWLCPTTCYDHNGMKDAGATMEGELIYSPFLPFEETKSNKMLANFVKYTGKGKKENVDSFAVFGWSATIAFQEALTAAVEEHGVNGVTRSNLLTALSNIHSFDAGGMLGKLDLAAKLSTPCYVLMRYTGGEFERIHPTKAGTFDCKSSNYATVKASPTG
jgi:ABC-type branched-subunit amino acid transport system substrate-binding protein